MDYFAFKLSLIPLTPLSIYILFKAYTGQALRKQWANSELMPFTEENDAFLTSNFHPYAFLTDSEKNSLQRKIKFFLTTKNINGVANFNVTDDMKLLVAAEACLLIMNIQEDVFPGLSNIFLMEDTFIEKDNPINPVTGVPMAMPKLGEAWKGGPIVLSWKAIYSGLKQNQNKANVVFHEFAHNLDQQDGNFDGTPPLGKGGNYQRWSVVMSKEFFELKRILKTHHRSDIDSYGATNEAEFFAVLTEYFLSCPRQLQRKHPGIYEAFNQYFKLDPIRWDPQTS